MVAQLTKESVMELMRVGHKGHPTTAALALGGSVRVRDISGIIESISCYTLCNDTLEKLLKIDLLKLMKFSQDERIGACVGRIGKFLCIGLNYTEQAEGSGSGDLRRACDIYERAKFHYWSG